MIKYEIIEKVLIKPLLCIGNTYLFTAKISALINGTRNVVAKTYKI